MFCPECRSEYVDGISVCSDCGSSLVHELPEEEHFLEFDFIEVLSTMNQGDIALIRSVFDAENIHYEIICDNFNVIRPLADPARVIVREDQLEEAKNLLQDMELHVWALSNRGADEEADPE